jgi:hypothetical protein
MSEETGEGFLARWSRRKRQGEKPGGELGEEPTAEPAAEPSPPAPAARPACPIPNLPGIDPASLPPIEALQAGSDFSPFLRPGVPPLLRQAALRRMWSLDASIRDYIGPVEYQWDFNTPGGLPAGFASELVGDVKKMLAQAIGQPDEPEPPAAPAAAEKLPEPAGLPAPADDVAAPTAPCPAEGVPNFKAALPEPEPEPPMAPRRRHGGALPA